MNKGDSRHQVKEALKADFAFTLYYSKTETFFLTLKNAAQGK